MQDHRVIELGSLPQQCKISVMMEISTSKSRQVCMKIISATTMIRARMNSTTNRDMESHRRSCIQACIEWKHDR